MTDGTYAAWLGLERHGKGSWSFELTNDLTRHGQLFGGTGIAAMVATMKAEQNATRCGPWCSTPGVPISVSVSIARSRYSRRVAAHRRFG